MNDNREEQVGGVGVSGKDSRGMGQAYGISVGW